MVKISIIIPCYNAGRDLADAITSALSQKLPAHEVIVVNDGSTDNTEKIIKAYEGRIKYIQQTNQGVSRARNAGAALATGEWLLFLDADDLLLPSALVELYGTAKGSSAAVIFGSVKENREGKWIERFNISPEGKAPKPAKANFWRSLIVTPGTSIVKKSLHRAVNGFNAMVSPSEDRHYWLKCGVLADFKACKHIVLEKRFRSTSASSDKNRMVFMGMMAQLDFLNWGYDHDIDMSFIELETSEIIEWNLQRAYNERCWEAYQAILLYARFVHINIPLIRRSRLRLLFSPSICLIHDVVKGCIHFLGNIKQRFKAHSTLRLK